MALRRLLASALLLTLVLAGCSDGGGDGEETATGSSSSASSTASSASSSSSTPTSATTSGAPANGAPAGGAAAVVNGTEAKFSLSGADPDGDALSWELDFGDASEKATGTQLPANVTHTYAAGNFTANFTIGDGQASKSYEVKVTVAGAGSPIVTQSYSGEWVGGPYACALRRTAYAEADPQRNVLWDNVLIDPATIGRPFTAVFTAAVPAALIVLELTSEGGDAEYSQFIIPGTGGTLAGEVPEGAYFAFFSSCGGAMLTVEYATS